MDPRHYQFLAEVVGTDGARALAKAAEKSVDLEWAIVPRAIMAWIDVLCDAGVTSFDDVVPGMPNRRLTFKKSEAGYTGRIDLEDEPYAFADASRSHLAGAVRASLVGEDVPVPALVDPQLARLGKSIETLVRFKTANKLKKAAKDAGPGSAAQPIAPRPPVQPQPTQEGNVGQPGAADALPGKTAVPKAVPGTSQVKLPKINKKPSVKVTKSQSLTKCSICGRGQFTADEYVGCACMAELAKHVDTKVVADGYRLTFGPEWGADELATLIEALGK